MKPAKLPVLISFVVLALFGCGPPVAPPPTINMTALPWTNTLPRLSHSEVMGLFRGRASGSEITEVERLTGSTDRDSKERAMQIVLSKLTQPELLKVGINEIHGQEGGERWWAFAICRGFTNTTAVYEQALRDAGIRNWGIFSHGYYGCYALREDFLKARRLVQQSTNLNAIEMRVVEPEFSFQ